MNKTFDVVVIGSGPGGYPAAIKLAQHGKKVALVEAGDIGGTCLNRGCIPTKTLLSNAEVLHTIRHAHEYGIHTGPVSFDFDAMIQRKDSVVAQLRKSLEGLIKSHGVTIIKGFASFLSPKEIKVKGEESCIIHTKNTIIATGSEPKNIAAFAFDNTHIHSSTSILNLATLPSSIVIVGGGVIGCEFASLYHALGCKVTLVEALERLLPLECETISSFMKDSFTKRGITIHTSAFVDKVTKEKDGVHVLLKNGTVIQGEIALVAIGRELNSAKLGLDKAGVITDRESIPVDASMRTNVPGIYAIGDVVAKTMYAHTATHQGLVAAHTIAGHPSQMNYDAVPGVIFTRPEIGSVGLSLKQALARGYAASSAAYPFQALGKAQASLHTDGFAQIVADVKTGQILGAQVVGYEASNLLAPITYAIANELTLDSITETIHAHPTLAEAWMEASFLVQKLPLHFPPVAR